MAKPDLSAADSLSDQNGKARLIHRGVHAGKLLLSLRPCLFWLLSPRWATDIRDIKANPGSRMLYVRQIELPTWPSSRPQLPTRHIKHQRHIKHLSKGLPRLATFKCGIPIKSASPLTAGSTVMATRQKCLRCHLAVLGNDEAANALPSPLKTQHTAESRPVTAEFLESAGVTPHHTHWVLCSTLLQSSALFRADLLPL
jgi:hypothetical protein